jgi:hypothetical protein
MHLNHESLTLALEMIKMVEMVEMVEIKQMSLTDRAFSFLIFSCVAALFFKFL